MRKAYLRGIDLVTKQSYENKRALLEQEILRQAQVYTIDVSAYAVMSNHYHVVLHINKLQTDNCHSIKSLSSGIHGIKVMH